MKIVSRAQIYKITYPNGKIYIGQDRTCDINYFGSACSHRIEQENEYPITITKEILLEATDIPLVRLNKLERECIEIHRSNDPEIGYNQSPKIKKRQHIYESNPH